MRLRTEAPPPSPTVVESPSLPPFDPEEVAERARRARRRKRRRDTIIDTFLRIAVLGAAIGVWYLLSLRWPPLIMPGPVDVFQTLGTDWEPIYEGARITMTEVFYGFLLGGGGGFLTGLLVAHSRRAEAVLGPFVVMSQSVPKSALAPLFVIWFGFGIASKVAVAASIAFFPIIENTVTGLRRVEDSHLKLFRVCGSNRWTTFWRLRLIVATPLIMTAVRISLVYALIGAVVGEFISGNEGLGALVIVAQGNFSTELVFASLIVLTALGASLYWGARLVENLLLKRLRLGSGSIGNDFLP